MSHDDKSFVDQIRQTLDRHADTLDEMTAVRLAAARRNALDCRPRRTHWLPVAALSALAASVLTVALLLNQDVSLPGDDPEALELVAQSEDLELIEDLDFYNWLDTTQASS